MPPTIADLLGATNLTEDSDWEFKSAKGGFPRSFWTTYSAMANSEGGTVVLGASDEHGVIRLDGLTSAQIATCKRTLWDGVNNSAVVNRNLIAPTDVAEVRLGDVDPPVYLLAITVPRAGRTERPVHVGSNPFGGTYRRRHEGDYRCTDEDVRRMIADASPAPADHRILAGFSLADLDASSLAQYRQRLRSVRGEHPWLALGDQELLEQLGGWRRDRTSGDEGLTLAGLLMFGRDSAIRDPAAAPNYFVDYREKLDPTQRWTDRVFPDGTWQANLLQFYTRVWPRLAAALPTPFVIEAGVRRDDSEAHVALREAFVNSMIHADYSALGGVVITREPDVITMENPGTLLVSMQQYERGGVSECRNKGVQRMFLMIGGGEQAGSGASRIRAGWRSRAWRAPWIDTFSEPDRVLLTLPMVSLIPDSVLAELRTLFGDSIESVSADELQALATAALEGGVSNARLRSLTTLHASDMTKLLQGLCDRGLLRSDGYGRWTTYHLARPEDRAQRPDRPWSSGGVGDLAFPREPGGARSSGPLGSSSGPLAPSSGPLESSSGPLAAGSGTSGRSVPSEPLTLWDNSVEETLGLSQEEFRRLRAIAEPVALSGRAARETVEAVILALCTGRFLTGDQLSQLLRRSAEKLRKDYLSPLVASNRLRYRHADAPTSPNQAYTAETMG